MSAHNPTRRTEWRWPGFPSPSGCSLAVQNARVNTNTDIMEFSLRDPDGYYDHDQRALNRLTNREVNVPWLNRRRN